MAEKRTKAEATRENIYQSALRLFISKGYNETTMRDIAKEAGVSLGSSYNYYDSKGALVLDFYVRNQIKSLQDFENIKKHRDFPGRVRAIIRQKFEQFQPYRNLLLALLQDGLNPLNPVSPFSAETKDVRDEAIKAFEDSIEETGFFIHKKTRPYIARLFWLYQLGLLMYWTVDQSEQQKNTRLLFEKSTNLIFILLKLQRLPLLNSINRNLFAILDGLLGEPAASDAGNKISKGKLPE